MAKLDLKMAPVFRDMVANPIVVVSTSVLEHRWQVYARISMLKVSPDYNDRLQYNQ